MLMEWAGDLPINYIIALLNMPSEWEQYVPGRRLLCRWHINGTETKTAILVHISKCNKSEKKKLRSELYAMTNNNNTSFGGNLEFCYDS